MPPPISHKKIYNRIMLEYHHYVPHFNDRSLTFRLFPLHVSDYLHADTTVCSPCTSTLIAFRQDKMKETVERVRGLEI